MEAERWDSGNCMEEQGYVTLSNRVAKEVNFRSLQGAMWRILGYARDSVVKRGASSRLRETNRC